MSEQKSTWLPLTLAITCIGCCAMHLYLIMTGIFGAGVLTALINSETIEVLICLLPIFLLVVYLILKRYQTKKSCCTVSPSECSSTECGIRE